MHQYKALLQHILDDGTRKSDRTGTGTISVFGYQLRFDLRHGFPLQTTKKIHIPSVVHELLWFIKGDTNVQYLNENGVRIWNEWADDNGNLGPIYGAQWRSWADGKGGFIDQLANAIDTLKTNPDSRRNIVSAWNVGALAEMKLPPCHLLFQFNASPMTNAQRNREYQRVLPADRLFVEAEDLSDERLDAIRWPKYYVDLQLYQRSADCFLGVPFNIASYSLLLSMVAQQVNMTPRFFVHSLGDAHIYLNHLDQVDEVLSRDCLPICQCNLNKKSSIDEYLSEDIEFVNYQHHSAIKAKVAV